MSDFVSVLDLAGGTDYAAQRAVKDEIATMDLSLRRTMDTGLPPEEMKQALAAREAVHAASAILDKIFS